MGSGCWIPYKTIEQLFASFLALPRRGCLYHFICVREREGSLSLGARRRMEEGLLVKERGEGEVLRWGEIVEETKKVGYIAGPMVAVTVSQFLLQVISVMMVGHLGELALSGTATATSLTNVTGFSVLLGMANALETMCGQAYGARQYKKIGLHTYSAMISLILVCIPLSLLWVNLGNLLSFIGQDPLISTQAGKYAIWLIPALLACTILQPLLRYFQSQSMILPMLLSSCATLLFHIPLCWVLVFKSGLRSNGAALAIDISFWLNTIMLVLYMKYSSSCAKTRVPLSMEALRGIGEFFRLAIPSAVMVCLEWWTFEVLILLSGLLPNPKLETSVLSICLTTTTMLFTIPSGFGAAASIRVSNELGAGNPHAARVAVCAVMMLVVIETLIDTSIIYSCRYVLGHTYSNEKEVINYVTEMAPLISLSVIMDSLSAVLSGVARGCGWQHLGALVNFGAFYLVGIPMAIVLAFHLHLRGKGLWIGLLIGCTLQNGMVALITSCTNWKKQSIKARERIFEGRCLVENGLN